MSSTDQTLPEQRGLAIVWRDLKRLPTVANDLVERALSDNYPHHRYFVDRLRLKLDLSRQLEHC